MQANSIEPLCGTPCTLSILTYGWASSINNKEAFIMLYEIRRYEILDNGKPSTSFAVLETETCKSRGLKRAAFLHASLNAEQQGYNRRHPDKQKNSVRVVTYKVTQNGTEFVANALFLN